MEPYVEILPLVEIDQFKQSLDDFDQITKIEIHAKRHSANDPDREGKILQCLLRENDESNSVTTKVILQNLSTGLNRFTAQKLIHAAAEGYFSLKNAGYSADGKKLICDSRSYPLLESIQISQSEGLLPRAQKMNSTAKKVLSLRQISLSNCRIQDQTKALSIVEMNQLNTAN